MGRVQTERELRPRAAQARGRPRPHLVLVSLVFHPDSSASSLMFTDLFRRLARGVKVTVLTGFPSKDAHGSKAELPRVEWFDGIEIVRCGVRLQGKRNLFARAVAYGSFLLHAGLKLLRLERNATIIGGTDPPFTPVALWLLSRIGRFQYECVLHDLYPDLLVGTGKLSNGSIITRLWRALNRRAFRAARRVTVIGRDMRDLLSQEYGIPADRLHFVRLWGVAEVDALDTIDRPGLLTRLGIADKFVVQYAGNMGLLHDMESLVRAADRLRHHPTIHFLFIGKGMRRAEAEALARELGLPNITWMDFLQRDQLAQGLLSCDVALVSLGDGLAGVAVPSKLYGILASGRPVIAQVPVNSEIAYVLKEENCGLVVEPGDVDGLVRAIESLAADPDGTRRMGRRARDAYESTYTIEKAVDAYRELWGL